MGNPASNELLGFQDFGFDKDGHYYLGYKIEEANRIFLSPLTLEVFSDDWHRTLSFDFVEAKWRNENYIQALYKVEDYYVLFNFVWNFEKEEFEYKDSREFYYFLRVEVKPEPFADTFKALKVWRTEQIAKMKRCHNYDIINTTHFNAKLDCEYYEPVKMRRDEDSHRICCGKKDPYVHIATFHIEPHKVPPYPLPAPCDFFHNYNYRVEDCCCAAPPPPKPTKKRKDFN